MDGMDALSFYRGHRRERARDPRPHRGTGWLGLGRLSMSRPMPPRPAVISSPGFGAATDGGAPQMKN